MLKKFMMCLTTMCAATIATAALGQSVTTTRVASGLALPLWVGSPLGDFNRLFILEQRSGSIGRVRVLDITTNPPVLSPTIYLSVSPVATGNEEGLLGLAFHPDFLNNGYFWVYYTNSSGNNVVARYRANEPYATSTTANPAGTIILTLNHPTQSNHNGGWIAFEPGDTNGYLYISTGDGGSGNDPPNNAQNINAFLGKMLRLDVDGADGIPGNDDDDGVLGNGSTNGYTSPPSNPFFGATPGLDEIWAYGLRNPWRCSFDRSTGELWIGDVGQNAIEEISYQPADVNGSMGGRNYGWRCMEGNNCTGLTGCTCNSPTLIPPVHAYNHGLGICVTGGYVYRGSAIPSLQGHYFFADFSSNQIWSFLYAGVNNPAITNRTAQLAPGGGLSINSITSFGEDAASEMYIVDRGGEVFKIIPGPPANDSCVNATLVSNGNTAFTSASATTDGPDEGASCFSGNTQIASDVWYKYLATCDGTATVSLCGATFDTRLAVYGNCPTAPGQLIACNDNACGSASELSFPVVSNTLYRIRIGGANGATGTGTMVVGCTTPPLCPLDLTGDNIVNVSDMLAVINAWGACQGCPADINNDGVVNVTDMLEVINGWGACK